jgi:hypothetical protein
MAVRESAATWIPKRRERQLDWKTHEGWLRHHVLPEIGISRSPMSARAT